MYGGFARRCRRRTAVPARIVARKNFPFGPSGAGRGAEVAWGEQWWTALMAR
ncbi:MAG: hypothetical protein R2734_00415 [Nocardioides sp.]